MERENNVIEDENKKHRLLDLMLIIIIIILILLLLWLWFRVSDFKKKVPNISQGDVFEITCDCDNGSAVSGDAVDSGTSGSDSSSFSQGAFLEEGNQTDTSIVSGSLEASDSNIIWQNTSRLRIFSNPVYQMDEVIAPGSSNEYHFTIKNNASCNLTYELNFLENNGSDINMKYRIKRNGQYLVSDYVSISEISKVVNQLPNSKKDDYSLEWKWVEGSNDTEVGSNVDAVYQLSITIVGKQVI